MPLVVVHGDHRVILAGAELDEDRIAGDRANYIVPVCHGLGCEPTWGEPTLLLVLPCIFRRTGCCSIIRCSGPAMVQMNGGRRSVSPARNCSLCLADDLLQRRAVGHSDGDRLTRARVE